MANSIRAYKRVSGR